MIKKCVQCGLEFDESSGLDICLSCLKEQAQGTSLINKLIHEGHSYHCAFRQVWGDGECECETYERRYDPYGWIKR